MSGVFGSLSLITRVTVRPPPTSEVPVMGASPTFEAFRSSRLTVMLAMVSRLASSTAWAGLPAASVTLAFTVSGPSLRLLRSAVVL